VKIVENRPIFGEDMDKIAAYFFGATLYISSLASMRAALLTLKIRCKLIMLI